MSLPLVQLHLAAAVAGHVELCVGVRGAGVAHLAKSNEFLSPAEVSYRLRARHADGRAWSGSGQQLKQRLPSKLFLQGGKVVSLRVPGTTQRPARKGSAFKLVLAGHAGV